MKSIQIFRDVLYRQASLPHGLNKALLLFIKLSEILCRLSVHKLLGHLEILRLISHSTSSLYIFLKLKYIDVLVLEPFDPLVSPHLESGEIRNLKCALIRSN